MAKRSRSSRRWLREHFDDEHVKRARQEGWRSRAVYKLAELDEKYRLLRPGMTVVDLGAAPGGWSQYAAHRLGDRGRIVALDRLPMDPIAGVDFLQGDFLEQEVLDALRERIGNRPVDLVMSDMAPNLSGMEAVDQPRAMYLAELAEDFARQVLAPGGTLIAKLFQGEGFDELIRRVRGEYAQVRVRKPRASRPRSREVYLVATGRRMV